MLTRQCKIREFYIGTSLLNWAYTTLYVGHYIAVLTLQARAYICQVQYKKAMY